MARRIDHTRAELRDLIIVEGHRLMAEEGFARFSARQVAKRIGYVLGTLYNVFGNLDAMVFAINTRTFEQWAAAMEDALQRKGDDPIAAMVGGYFDFARDNRNLWTAIYDHHLPGGFEIPEDQAVQRGRLTAIVAHQVARVLPQASEGAVAGITRSLIATVHGHCVLALGGSFALMGEEDPQGAALTRVRQTLEAEAARP